MQKLTASAPADPTATTTPAPLDWRWWHFSEMPAELLYGVLRLRQQVFVVEQTCVYLDCDNRDQFSLHLVGWPQAGRPDRPLAYLRLIPPHGREMRASLGRLLTHPKIRGQGIGSELLGRALHYCRQNYPGKILRISAQRHLCQWYADFGFAQVGAPYSEDGIPHVEMVLQFPSR